MIIVTEMITIINIISVLLCAGNVQKVLKNTNHFTNFCVKKPTDFKQIKKYWLGNLQHNMLSTNMYYMFK